MGEKLGKHIPEPNSGCWLWLGSVDKDGYGTIRRVDGAHLKAHRESYRYHCQDPDINQVLHHCDTPCCINPDHLYEGDPAANARDKRVRGRARSVPQPGETNPMAKLTAADVVEIKRRCFAGELQKTVAQSYGIQQGTVSKIVRDQRWSAQSNVANA